MAIHVSVTTDLQHSFQHEDDSTLWVDTGGTNDAVVTDPVGRWDDQTSSNNLTEGTTSAKPTRASDGLSFDGGDRLGNSTIGAIASSGGNFSIHMALNPNNLGSYGVIFGFGSSSAESYIAFGANDAGTQYGFASVSGGSGYSEVGGGTLASSLVCISVIRSGSTITAYVNNSQVVQDTGISSPTLNRFHLGALMAFGTFVAYGNYDELKCCYVYNTAHGSTDRTTIYNDIDGVYINPSSEIEITPSPVTITVNTPAATAVLESPIDLTPATKQLTLSVPTSSMALESPVEVTPSPVSMTLNVPTAVTALENPIALTPASKQITLNIPTANIALELPIELTPLAKTITLSVPVSAIALELPLGVTPSTKEVTLSAPTATVTTDDPLEVTPSVKQVTISHPTATVQSENALDVTPSPVTLTISVPTAIVTNGTIEVAPNTAVLTINAPTATVSLESPIALTPDTLSITMSIFTGTVSLDDATLETLITIASTVIEASPIESTLRVVSPIQTAITTASPITSTLQEAS